LARLSDAFREAGKDSGAHMELDKIIRDLHEERRQLDEAIRVLEKLAAGSVARRGRPPKWLSAIKAAEESVAPKALPRKGKE
jgi:hypothetical protein